MMLIALSDTAEYIASWGSIKTSANLAGYFKMGEFKLAKSITKPCMASWCSAVETIMRFELNCPSGQLVLLEHLAHILPADPN